MADSLGIEVERVSALVRSGVRVVWTNGCFDILHVGHLDTLEACRTLAERGRVVVGLNTDESIRRLKGLSRPIMTYEERRRLLLTTKYVDFVVPLEDDTPERIIGIIRPQVVVKGGDWIEADLPEAKIVLGYGGKMIMIPGKVESTTDLIERLKVNG